MAHQQLITVTDPQQLFVLSQSAAIELVRELLIHSGEELEVKSYNRLTKLEQESEALGTLKNVQPGDCIVCFSKQDIYDVSRGLETLGVVSCKKRPPAGATCRS